ncbi:MAG TPA: DUF1707 domain-containing protein [Acidimicrobiales bacterium]|nr:DUF1707 domain-containing protein [Acidimicrobiales bacterium]
MTQLQHDPAVAPSDFERERVAGLLRDAVGKGILTIDEFETRLDAVYDATTLPQLDELVRWLPSAPRRKARKRTVVLSLAATAFAAGLFLAVNANTVDAPTVTSVASTGFGNQHNVVHIKWPRGIRHGWIESPQGADAVRPGQSVVVDYTVHRWPVSYRAVGCKSECDFVNGTGDLVYGPWHRPDVRNLLDARPTVSAEDVAPPSAGPGDPTPTVGLRLTVRLREHAPAIVVYRGDDVVDMFETNGRFSVSQYVPRGDGTVPVSVAPCYSDCDGISVNQGFAQVGARSRPIAGDAN